MSYENNNNIRTVKWSDRGCLTNSSRAAVPFFDSTKKGRIGRNEKVSLAVLRRETTPVRGFGHFLKSAKEKNKKTFCAAFTLAEVLITLGIIGVIAAITIPAVIQNTQSQETVVKLKKAYNTLKMVERQATVDRGPMSEWAWTGNTVTDFNTFFRPYFDIMKDCGTGTGCFGKEYYNLDGAVWLSDVDGTTTYYKFITSDGMSFNYTSYNPAGVARRGAFRIDLNGLKEPNKLGRDLFDFTVFPTLGIKPSGAYDWTTAEPISSTTIDANCSASGNGWNCAAKVLSENAINY